MFLPLVQTSIVILPLLFKLCDFTPVILKRTRVFPWFVPLLVLRGLNGRKKMKKKKHIWEKTVVPSPYLFQPVGPSPHAAHANPSGLRVPRASGGRRLQARGRHAPPQAPAPILLPPPRRRFASPIPIALPLRRSLRIPIPLPVTLPPGEQRWRPGKAPRAPRLVRSP